MDPVRRANTTLALLATVFFGLLWLPAFNPEYGYFIDELYYLACASHPAWGYVDHPPLSVMVLWLVRGIAGDALPVIRLVPALAGGLTVLLTGLLARRLGANAFGQAIAAGAVMVSAIYQVMFGFFSMNAIAILLWTVAFLILVEIERASRPRLWLAFGAVAGLAFQNKHTFVLLVAGLAVGLVLSPARRHLASRWLWLGAALAAAILVPNLIWQAANGWPSLEFYRNADLYKNVPTPPLDVLAQQVIFMNPAAAPVWVAGLAFFLGTARGRPYRHLGWVYVVLLAMMLVGQKSRPDRITSACTVLFAGGGVLVGEWVLRRGLRWLRVALPAALVVGGAAMAPISLPVLPAETAAAYAAWTGIVPQIEQGEGKQTALPQWLADRRGWEQLVDDVAAVAARLGPDERRRTVILAPSYGHAGAVELLGRGRDLPPVFGTQNTYFHWGPPPEIADTAIVLGPFTQEFVDAVFEESEVAIVYRCAQCMPWRNDVPIWIARGRQEPWSEVWPTLRHYE